jgi:6-phosphofructokinase 1
VRVGVLTGGGDVPGLNPCIKALVYGADERGWQVIGIRRGWAGLLHYDLDLDADADTRSEWVQVLDRTTVRTIDRYGGTHLHTSRTNPQKVRRGDLPEFLTDHYPFAKGQGTVDCTPHVLSVIHHLRLDAVVAIGGDDTLSYAVRLHREGINVIGIPKTMDNDVYGTDYCIGFSTAVTRSVDLIHALRTPTGSHERIAVIELFGRNSGETSLVSAYLADVDRALISEVPFDIERLGRMVIDDRSHNPSNYAIVTVSEGATMIGGQVVEYGQEDAYGHRKLGGIGVIIGDALKQLTGIDIVNQQLAYLMRAGAPDSLDRMVATSYGRLAIGLIGEGNYGQMVALQDGVYTTVPIETSGLGTKRVNVPEFYDTDRYRPKIRHLLGKPMYLS